MLRISVAISVLCLVVAVAGTAVTGLFSTSLVATAGVLLSGAAAVSRVRVPEDEEAAADGGADVRRLRPARTAPGPVVPGLGTDRAGRAA